MITLLKHVTVVGEDTENFYTDWVRVPESHQNWQWTLQVHGFVAGSAGTVQLQTTWDTGLEEAIGSSLSLASTGIQIQDILTAMGPMARLHFAYQGACVAFVSLWLTPKIL